MTNGKILVAFFVALLAVAITGKTTPIVGVNDNCIDALDNDGDTSFDWDDYECLTYPYADGGGEYGTTPAKQFASPFYEASVWEIHYQYFATFYGWGDPQWCFSFNDPGTTTNLNFYNQFTPYGDTSVQDFTDWEAANCP